jgi:hypothetical protein
LCGSAKKQQVLVYLGKALCLLFIKVYSKLASPEVSVARSLGISEAVMVSLMTGRALRNKQQLQPVLSRFYLALVLFNLWNAEPIHTGNKKITGIV